MLTGFGNEIKPIEKIDFGGEINPGINPETDITIGKAKEIYKALFESDINKDSGDLERLSPRNPNLPRETGENGEINGRWTGERGDSEWIPNPNKKPGIINPDNLSWKEISNKYGGEIRIPFIEGEPDFSRYSESTVVITDFTGERSANFPQADEAEALKRGCLPQEVAEWRKEHNYSWHERSDCKTMDLVPNEIHGNIPHSGGISQIKAMERWNG